MIAIHYMAFFAGMCYTISKSKEDQGMYIFWDNSNIHYAGLNHVRPLLEPGAVMENYRTYFSGLLNLVKQGRTVENIYFAGSVPPQNDALWN